MTNLSYCSAASNAPSPEFPAAVKMTSAPFRICATASSFPFPGIVPRRVGHAHVIVDDADLRIHAPGAFRVAHLEFPDQRDVHAADEAQDAGLRRARRDQPDEIRPLVLLENERCHVREVDEAVDDREIDVRIILRDALHDRRLREADTDDQIVAAFREGAHRGLDRGRVARLDVPQDDRKVLRRALDAFPGGGVERAVVLASDVEDDSDVNLLAVLAGAEELAAAGGDEGRDENDEDHRGEATLRAGFPEDGHARREYPGIERRRQAAKPPDGHRARDALPFRAVAELARRSAAIAADDLVPGERLAGFLTRLRVNHDLGGARRTEGPDDSRSFPIESNKTGRIAHTRGVPVEREPLPCLSLEGPSRTLVARRARGGSIVGSGLMLWASEVSSWPNRSPAAPPVRTRRKSPRARRRGSRRATPPRRSPR